MALVEFFRGFVVFVFARVVWVSGYMFFPLRVLLGVVLGVMVFWAGSAAAGASAAVLPDGRVYELVSVSGSGEPYLPPTPIEIGVAATGFRARLPFRAGENGDSVAYVAEPSAEAGTGETGPGEGNQWLAARASGGWSSEDITPSENRTAMYESFSSDLTTAFYEGNSTPLPLTSVESGCAALYTRAQASRGFRALFTAGKTPGNCGHPLFAGASGVGPHVIFQSEAALTPEAEEAGEVPPGHGGAHRGGALAGEGCMFGCNLYDSVGGHLELVNIVEGALVPSATFGGYAGEHELTNFSNVISSDGSRIYWTDTGAGAAFERVYVREEGPKGRSNVQVSGSAPAEYWTATPDGSSAFYTEGGILYRFDIGAEANKRTSMTSAGYSATAAGELRAGSEEITAVTTTAGFHEGDHLFGVGIPTGTTITEVTANTLRLSKPATVSGEKVSLATGGPEVQGVIGINEGGADGAYVYFVAENGELATNGEHGVNKAPNLYLRHEDAVHNSVTTLIATLAPKDNELQSASEGSHETSSDWRANLGERLAQVTRDGQHLVFQSVQQLTGYSSSFETQQQPEVFVYSANDGHLACASCDPTGAPPSITEGSLPKTRLPVSAEAETYTRRWISEDGSRVFFDSAEPLVAQDTNEVQDVYEWERPATGAEPDNTCTVKAASPVTGGCTFLLSGGISKHDSFLVDADAKGQNVFFEHVGPLGQVQAPIDHNELYDTRVHGGFPQTTVGCEGTACRAASSPPPAFTAPASATFAGIGNFPPAPLRVVRPRTRQQKLVAALKACKKNKHRSKRLTCERQARRRYRAAKQSAIGSAKRASYDRRGQS